MRRYARGEADDLQLQATVLAFHDGLLPAQRLKEAVPAEGLPVAAAQRPQHPQAAPRPVRPRLQRLQQEPRGGLQVRPGRAFRALSLSGYSLRGRHAPDARFGPQLPGLRKRRRTLVLARRGSGQPPAPYTFPPQPRSQQNARRVAKGRKNEAPQGERRDVTPRSRAGRKGRGQKWFWPESKRNRM